VPGGHHGPWVWGRLQTVLDAHGWSSQATTLLSAVCQEAPALPLPGMYDDARAIRAAIDGIAAPLIVVAAYMLDVGEGMFQTHGIPVPATLEGLRPPENPDLNLLAAFYDGDPENPETAQASARLVPQTVRADFETVTQAGWRTVPNSYVIPDADLSITGTVAEQMAARADTVYRCPGHHAPFYSHPREFAEILVEIGDRRWSVTVWRRCLRSPEIVETTSDSLPPSCD
jgi:hypothetical protein